MPRCVTKSTTGPLAELSPERTTAANVNVEHRAGRVVERRLGDDRLRDLRPDPEPLEERDQDRRVGRRERGADQEADRGGEVEDRGRDEAGDHGGDDHAGDDEQAEPDRHSAEHARRELEPPWKRMIDTPSVSRSCDRRRVERDVDPVDNRGSEERSGTEQEQHPRQPRTTCDQDSAESPAASMSARVRTTSSASTAL